MSFSPKETLAFIGRSAKRVMVAVVGGALVVAGIAFIPLPGPGALLIFLGFGVLATEFAWAAVVLEKGKRQTARITGAARRIIKR